MVRNKSRTISPLKKETIAGMSGNEEDAPIPAVR
jgi:hypothetical protein